MSGIRLISEPRGAQWAQFWRWILERKKIHPEAKWVFAKELRGQVLVEEAKCRTFINSFAVIFNSGNWGKGGATAHKRSAGQLNFAARGRLARSLRGFAANTLLIVKQIVMLSNGLLSSLCKRVSVSILY